MQEVISLNESEISRTKAQIKIQDSLPAIRANKTLLLQMFANLVGNALKFTKKTEPLRLQIFVSGMPETCEVHVKDNGIGIAPEYQAKIFNPFNRGGADRTILGSGVGLAIVKKAAERIGAPISLRSEPNKGTEFIIDFPSHLCTDLAVSPPVPSKAHR